MTNEQLTEGNKLNAEIVKYESELKKAQAALRQCKVENKAALPVIKVGNPGDATGSFEIDRSILSIDSIIESYCESLKLYINTLKAELLAL